MSNFIEFLYNFVGDLFRDNSNGSVAEMEELISSSIAIYPSGLAVVIPPDPAELQTPNLGEVPETISWEPEKTKPVKTTIIPCIVIDRNNRWHQNAKVDCKDINTSDFTWGYYGKNQPVFVESSEGKLVPFYLHDIAGESSNRLYKGANPSGFKATFKHRSDLLRKVQVGLMVALVLGLFFLMFLFMDWK